MSQRAPGRLVATLAAGLLAATALPALAQGQAADRPVTVLGLETEAQPQPLGIDVEQPRLTWRMAADRRGVYQSAYRVRVASSRAAAVAGRADVWDSGRVVTGRPSADYRGPELAAGTRYWWSVELWDEQGTAARSAPAWFETAFTDPSQWTADWVSGPSAPQGCAEERQCRPAPLLREEFVVGDGVESARLYASGLGYGTYWLNGRRVGDAVLSPGFTEYTERALYVTHDVTDLLQPGSNAVGAQLGRGPFGSTGSNFAGYAAAPWHADPQLRLELHVRYRNGREDVVRSGPGWTTTDGPTRFDDYMLGESYDARRASELAGWATAAYDDQDWQPVRSAPGPQGALEAQVEEPVRPQETLAFRSVTRTASGTWRFDLPENVTGTVVLDTDLPAGTTITMHHGEKLLDNGSVDTVGGSFDGKPLQLDTYTAGPGRDVWRAEYTFKGFQHVEVTGLPSEPSPSMLRAEVWHTDFPATGSFESSHDLVNRIYAASRRAVRSNSLSIPMDTPVYEKTGYTADGQLVAGAASWMFDTRRFYDKWLTDVRQSVAPNGDMGISAPLPSDPAEGVRPPVGINHTTPGWDAALMVIPEVLKRFHGDERHGVRALSEMKRVREHYETRVVGDVLPGTCTVAFSQICNDGLGDWTAPTGSSYGAAVDSTAWYAWMLRRMAETARDAGDRTTAESADARAEQVRAAFQRTFFDPVSSAYRDHLNPEPGEVGRQTNGVFFNGEPLRPPPPDVPQVGLPGYTQHQNALPLGLDLVPADQRQAVGDTLAADVRLRRDHLSTGIVGTRFLFEALASTGHVDEAFAVLTQTTYPSYGYWLDTLGYTSLGEFWEGNQRSLNHQMYGSVVQWLFEGLAGIRPTAPGFETLQVRPEIPSNGLDHVRASSETVRGRVASAWRRTNSGLVLDVTVPAGTTAEVHVPAPSGTAVRETGSGRSLPVAVAPGVQDVAREEDRLLVVVGSGTYSFVIGAGAPSSSSSVVAPLASDPLAARREE